MLWDNIQGQDGAVAYLRQSIKKGRVTNAYLFQGPEGVGKTLTATVFARALNCRVEPGEACGTCADCREIENGAHPDVHSLAPGSKSRLIIVKQLRQMQRLVYLRSGRDNWKVFIIREAERMNVNAQNAFLKTLEEPPERTTLILITHQPELLLPTIRSRCQRVSFNSWSFQMMMPFLMEKAGLAEDACHVLHAISGGRPGRALRLAREGVLKTRREVLGPLMEGRAASAEEVISRAKSWLDYLGKRSRALSDELEKEREAISEALEPHQKKEWEDRDKARIAAGEREDLEMIFELIFSWIRDLFICQHAGREAPIINRDLEAGITAASGERPPGQLRRMMEWVEKSRRLALKAATRSTRQLVFENMLLQLGYWQPH